MTVIGMEKKTMSLFGQLLQGNKCKIKEAGNKILITGADVLYPEDYIEVKDRAGSMVVSEVHRAESKEVINTSVNEKAIIFACVLSMRLFETLSRDTGAEKLKKYVKNNEISCADAFLENLFSNTTYAIGTEDVSKISLIKNEGKGNVKYRNEYLVQNTSMVRAYGVLYNCSRKLERIREWYKRIDEKYLKNTKAEEIEALYILGKVNSL